MTLVARLVMERAEEFEEWQLRDMIGEIEAHWKWNKDIHPIDKDVQMQFRQGLIDALAERSAKSE